MILREGESLTLNCKASGFPMPNIWWKKNGLRISSSDNGRISNVSEAGVGTLKITNLLTSDAGKYDCVAENTLDSRLSPIQMTVHVRCKHSMRSHYLINTIFNYSICFVFQYLNQTLHS